MSKPVRIVIGNLPDDASEEGIREALKAFVSVGEIKLVRESGAPTAVLEVAMGRPQAEALAKRIAGRIYQGKALNAWVPTMDW